MVRKISGCGTAFAHGARARGGKPALADSRDEQRNYGRGRSVWADIYFDPARRARSGGFAVRLPDRPDAVLAFRRLVRVAVRDGFGYSSGANFWEARKQRSSEAKKNGKSENEMILEDLQHRYEGLKQRITLVRSYL